MWQIVKWKELIPAGSACGVSHRGVPLMCCNLQHTCNGLTDFKKLADIGLKKAYAILRSLKPEKCWLNWIVYDFLIITKLHLTRYTSDVKLHFTYFFFFLAFLSYFFFTPTANYCMLRGSTSAALESESLVFCIKYSPFCITHGIF